ncbi:hypothetical protein BRC62_03895 [Halobacteriales archaeon QH_10_67_13]|nr:MAG: hypothetical protein BRC62_03895 [Halobacteriales archaeon QH_10_67_13]
MSNDRSPSVPSTLTDRWAELLEEATAIADRYRADGRETALVHPGDVTPLVEEPIGLDVVVPGNEFDAVAAAVEDRRFDRTRIYRFDGEDARLFVITVKDAVEAAVVVPAYLPYADLPDLRGRAYDAERMATHVRPLSDDKRVTFEHDDPTLFFPE